MKIKIHYYQSYWHDGGMTVVRDDGKRASFYKRRETHELNNMTEKEMFKTLKPYVGHRRFL